MCTTFPCVLCKCATLKWKIKLSQHVRGTEPRKPQVFLIFLFYWGLVQMIDCSWWGGEDDGSHHHHKALPDSFIKAFLPSCLLHTDIWQCEKGWLNKTKSTAMLAALCSEAQCNASLYCSCIGCRITLKLQSWIAISINNLYLAVFVKTQTAIWTTLFFWKKKFQSYQKVL